MIGFLREHHAPELPPLPPRPVCEGGRVSVAHERHPIGESWVGGLTVEAYTWRASKPSLRVRCVCGWVGELSVRALEDAEDEGRVPRCPVQGACRDHRGPVADEPDRMVRERGRPKKGPDPVQSAILEAYERLAPGWPGTRATLCRAAVEAAGLVFPVGYTGASMRVSVAMKARREGRL